MFPPQSLGNWGSQPPGDLGSFSAKSSLTCLRNCRHQVRKLQEDCWFPRWPVVGPLLGTDLLHLYLSICWKIWWVESSGPFCWRARSQPHPELFLNGTRLSEMLHFLRTRQLVLPSEVISKVWFFLAIRRRDAKLLQSRLETKDALPDTLNFCKRIG